MGTYALGIVGESYRQDAIRHCRQGDRVILRREPENPHDANAVAVLREDGEQIGYLSRDHAVWVAERMDKGRQVEAKIKLLTGGTKDKPTRGVVIEVDTTPPKTEKPQAETGGFWKGLFGRGR
jgi:single-stranded-DNA-specific exonuclease